MPQKSVMEQIEEASKSYKPEGGGANPSPASPPAGGGNEDWRVWDAAGQPEKPGFLSSAVDMIKRGPGNLAAFGDAINGFVAHPSTILPAVSRMGQQTIDLAKDAGGSFRRGDVIGGVRRGLNAAINTVAPGLGAQSEEAGQEFDKGNTAAGLGKTAGVGVNTVLGLSAPKVANAAGAAVSNTPRAIGAVGTGLKAAGPDLATGGAMIAGGEALAQIPGMGYPARIGLGLPGAHRIARGIGRGASATREAFSAEGATPSVSGVSPRGGLPSGSASPFPTQEPPVRVVQHLGDMRINGRTPAAPKMYDAYGRLIPPAQ